MFAEHSIETRPQSNAGHKEKRADAILERHYLARTSDMARCAMANRTAMEAGEKHGLF